MRAKANRFVWDLILCKLHADDRACPHQADSSTRLSPPLHLRQGRCAPLQISSSHSANAAKAGRRRPRPRPMELRHDVCVHRCAPGHKSGVHGQDKRLSCLGRNPRRSDRGGALVRPAGLQTSRRSPGGLWRGAAAAPALVVQRRPPRDSRVSSAPSPLPAAASKATGRSHPAAPHCSDCVRRTRRWGCF